MNKFEKAVMNLLIRHHGSFARLGKLVYDLDGWMDKSAEEWQQIILENENNVWIVCDAEADTKDIGSPPSHRYYIAANEAVLEMV
jgi:hypothetical protein